MNTRLGARIGLLAVALTMVALLSWQAEGAGADEPVQVSVTLKDFTLTAAPLAAPVGDVQFNATNQGAVAHELVVLKTDLAADALPRRPGIDRVDEAGAGELIGEIEDAELGPGQSANAIMNLAAGRYILLCNLEEHYTAGMYTVFTVSSESPTAAPTAASVPQSGGAPGDSSSGFTTAWIWLAAGVIALGAAAGGLRLASRRSS